MMENVIVLIATNDLATQLSTQANGQTRISQDTEPTTERHATQSDNTPNIYEPLTSKRYCNEQDLSVRGLQIQQESECQRL